MPTSLPSCRRPGRLLLALAAALACAALACLPLAAAPRETATAARLRHFETRVRPLLVNRCGACHGEKLQQGKLRLDRREDLLRGGLKGPVVKPGDPAASLLLRAVRHQPGVAAMPPGGTRLSDRDIQALEIWIRDGAPWPTSAAKPTGELWSLRPLQPVTVPRVRREGWVRTPVDAFILARLEAEGIAPAPPADPATLLRRVTFDLTGLPPTPEEVRSFVADPSPQAYVRVVERLLASPRYGERWGRHWLDAVRYADTNGLDENYHYAHAWRYRDYVVDAFNRDLPYDQFLREQLAGDLLPAAGEAEARRRLVATGFLMLGPKLLANPDKAQVQADIIDEQIDVTTRAFLGITVACARCHDHKFDPISQRDYYGLAGIFLSTRTMESLKDRVWSERPLASPAEVARYEEHRRGVLEREVRLKDAGRLKLTDAETAALRGELEAMKRSAPPAPPIALAVDEGEVRDAPLLVRGDHNQPGPTVPRGFPAALGGKQAPRPSPQQSGRRELAEWITGRGNPLTARVMVNRVWQHHFGQPLVRTTDNFGTLGEPPSHPELLDWLALSFREGPQPWSLKALHRVMVLSETYRMATALPRLAPNDPRTADADNRLLWRMNRRRLSAEEQRDAMLAAAGTLDLTTGGSLMTEIPNKERVTNDGSRDLAAHLYMQSRRRTLYLPVVRNSLFELLETFDFADPSAVTARRRETISSPQSLFLLNHPLMQQAAGEFAARLRQSAGDDGARLHLAYLLAFGRPPTATEVRRAQSWLAEFRTLRPDAGETSPAWTALCHALFCSSEFLYVD